ncbi:MAG: protein-glutamate O-methyltransferase CheR [Acidobacteria bacterium]|nr:protein-glutamate O-methyltransferase CheR [Acidobacteriota bacterium]
MFSRRVDDGAVAPTPAWYDPPPLTDRELSAIVRLVYEKSGITLHEGKRALVTARLQKRLKALGASSYSEYLRHLEADASGNELVALLDAIATNHTSFFREPQHFELLKTRVVGEWLAGRPTGPFAVWSAACSTGEEPYTLAMTLRDALPGQASPGVRVLGSDLSTKALRTARTGVYKLERVRELPLEMLRRHFEKGLGAQAGLARVAHEVRRVVEFRQLNLLEIADLGERFPVIFCRNVMIYFDRHVQQRVVSMLERHLEPGGYLFISHSESLNGVTHRLRWVAPAVYQRRTA